VAKTTEVRIFTDGACSGNPGPGGYGVILQYGESQRRMSLHIPKVAIRRRSAIPNSRNQVVTRCPEIANAGFLPRRLVPPPFDRRDHSRTAGAEQHKRGGFGRL